MTALTKAFTQQVEAGALAQQGLSFLFCFLLFFCLFFLLAHSLGVASPSLCLLPSIFLFFFVWRTLSLGFPLSLLIPSLLIPSLYVFFFNLFLGTLPPFILQLLSLLTPLPFSFFLFFAHS